MIADILLGLVALVTASLVITVAVNLWLRVPSVPTPMAVVREMVRYANLNSGDRVVDLGAGDGRLLLEAKRSCPGIIARGCELNPTVWLMGKVRMCVSRHNVSLKLRNALNEDLRDADVIFLYLFPELMGKLAAKFERELTPGTRVLSYMFQLPGREPVTTKKVRGFWGEAKVFAYRWTSSSTQSQR